MQPCSGFPLSTLRGPFIPGTDHADLTRVSGLITGDLVTPPEPGPDICPLCYSWRDPATVICGSCEATGSAVGYPIGPPSVITLYTKPSDLRDWLTRYKGRPGDDADPFDQESFDRVRAILGRYLLEHGSDLSHSLGAVDAIVTVPSGGGRPLPHPLQAILSSLALEIPIESMLVRGPGELRYRVSSRDGYRLTVQTPPRRVLLVEDVFVTGARLFSASRALSDGGHTVAGALVIARRVNREWGGCQSMWDRQTASSFTWSGSPRTAVSDSRLLSALRGRSVDGKPSSQPPL